MAGGLLAVGGSHEPVPAEQAELFDEAASLKRVTLADVGAPIEALAFFLNLYHALLLHALLVLGAPRDATKSDLLKMQKAMKEEQELLAKL